MPEHTRKSAARGSPRTDVKSWPMRGLALGMLLLVGCTVVQPRQGVLAQESWIERPLRKVEWPRGEAGPSNAAPEGALPWERSPEQEEIARRAEVERALAHVVAIASGVDRMGTTLGLTYWVEQGAVTLVGFSAHEGQQGRAEREVNPQRLGEELKRALRGYGGKPHGLMELLLRRERHGWVLDHVMVKEGPRPPEARRLAVKQEAVASESYLRVSEWARRLVGAMQVPRGGEARQEVEVHLEDGRVLEASVAGWEAVRGGVARRAVDPAVVGEVTWLLLGFCEGLGRRTVHLRLRAEHTLTETQGRAWVEAVDVERPARQAGEDEDFAAAYLAVHEETLRLFREELEEGARWVVVAGVEELALWYAGGIATRGMGVLADLTLPVVKNVLGRGGARAAGWLRSAVARLKPGGQQEFARLWAKLQLEGEAALTAAERDTVRKLMSELDRIVQQPLEERAKILLRRNARAHYRKFHPELEVLLRQEGRYPVHHRRPLEYAYLFPDEDINDPRNLALVHAEVHERISVLWGKLRKARPHATAEDVRMAAREIDELFKDWYDKVADTSNQILFESYLAHTESVAIERLRRLFPGLE